MVDEPTRIRGMVVPMGAQLPLNRNKRRSKAMIPDTVSPWLAELVREELLPDETILWAETPKPRFFTTGSTATFGFAVVWTAFSLFWVASALGFQVPNFDRGVDFFALFGVPFVLIGFAMLATPIWTYRNAFKTVYLLTDQRAITFIGGFRMTIRSFHPRELRTVYRKQSADGSGDVIFNAKRWTDSEGTSHSEEIGFLGIPDVKSVEQLLKQMVESHRRQAERKMLERRDG
ncbi:hypothetical protein [Rhodopirellula europaea]|uniref:Putative membrane protein n=1 Tax=Rhodopirellula europaea 6C TaxID=1263867 RepID=M2A5B0_9BACT|nr:hypothetical protein [Rhodopirellula europaea]EMB15306.1 putative membrane protein [Rhodopirellula europaea 6C]